MKSATPDQPVERSCVATYSRRMMVDRRGLADHNAMQVARWYEIQRGASCVDVSAGRTGLLTEPLALTGRPVPPVPSADLLSRLMDQVRIIEVKGRGGKGPLELFERQIDTFVCGGELAWLYVVWNCTQPQPYELWTVQEPGRLPWIQTQTASRTADQPRGTRHEGRFSLQYEEVERFGVQIDLGLMHDQPTK